MNEESAERPPLPIDGRPRYVLLSRSDQRCVAVFAALALVVIGVDYTSGQNRRRPAEFDGSATRWSPQIGFQLDINRADWPEWMLLPRIGETLARRIVADREEVGSFQTIDDLRRVPGIGPKTLALIRPFLRPLRNDAKNVTKNDATARRQAKSRGEPMTQSVRSRNQKS